MKNLEDRTVAWIFLALARTAGSESATLHEIAQVADGINHAVPTDKELTGSIRILKAMQFVEASGKSLSLTQAGSAFVASATHGQITMLGSWYSLATALSNIPRGGL